MRYNAAGEIDVRLAGARGDGVSNDSPLLQRLASSNPTATLYFPPGTYVLNNQNPAQAGLKLYRFSGKIRMDPGAAFACNTASNSAGQCVWLVDSVGVTFENLSITYLNADALPLSRNDAIGNALLVQTSSDVTLLNTTIVGSTGSGIWNTDSSNVRYLGTTSIRNTSADGIHFENVANGSIVNLTTGNTGDDGLAVTNIQQDNPNCGFTADQVSIHASHARGVLTAGACRASFSNIVIQNTAYSAIAITQDPSIESRQSTDISVSHAQVTGAGSLAGDNGNKYCVDIANSQQVHITDVTCDRTAGDGVFIYNHAANIDIENVRLTGSGNNGFQSGDGSSYVSFLHDRAEATQQNAFDIESSDHVSMQDCEAANSGGYGFFHSRSANISENQLVSRNASNLHGHNRSWWAESMTGPVLVDGLSIVDDQQQATGFIIGDYDNFDTLDVSGIQFQTGEAPPSIQAGPASNYYLAVAPPQ